MKHKSSINLYRKHKWTQGTDGTVMCGVSVGAAGAMGAAGTMGAAAAVGAAGTMGAAGADACEERVDGTVIVLCRLHCETRTNLNKLEQT